jgi:YHS domain-containing protein
MGPRRVVQFCRETRSGLVAPNGGVDRMNANGPDRAENALVFPIRNAKGSISMSHISNVNEAGIAIKGYDPVAYFSGTPTPGHADITSNYDGSIYRFANTENKGLFDAEPEKYLPQYGGFCALAMSEGKAVLINPTTFKILDGKLYLFYNGQFGNTLPMWEEEEQNRKTNADQIFANENYKVMFPTSEYVEALAL